MPATRAQELSQIARAAAVSFFAILAGLVFCLWQSAERAGEQAQITAELLEHPFAVSNASTETLHAAQTLRIAALNAILRKDPDKARFAGELQADYEKTEQENLLAISARYLGPPEDAAALREAAHEWRRLRRQAIFRALAGDWGGAGDMARDDGPAGAAYALFASRLKTVSDFAKGKASSLRLQALEKAEQNQRQTLLACALFCAYAAACAACAALRIRRALAALRKAAYADPVTGAPNRRLMGERLLLLRETLLPQNKTACLIAVEAAGLAEINAKCGRTSGDRALAALALSCQSQLGPGDLFARFDGPRFLIATARSQEPEIFSLLRRIAAAADAGACPEAEGGPKIRARFGLARLDPRDPLGLCLRKAELALARAGSVPECPCAFDPADFEFPEAARPGAWEMGLPSQIAGPLRRCAA